MVTIPSVRADVPGRSPLSGVSVTNPAAADDSASMKRGTQLQFKGLFEYSGNQYKLEQEKIKRADDAMALVRENQMAAGFYRQTTAEAESLPVNERFDFLTEALTEYNEGRVDEYDDPAAKARVADLLQQRQLRAEGAAWDGFQRQKASENVAMLETNLNVIHADIVNAGSEAERVGLYQQLDDSLSTASELGFITPESREGLRQSYRAKSVSGIIGKHIVSENYAMGLQYLEANRELLTPEQQNNIELQLRNGARAVQQRAEVAKIKAQNDEMKKMLVRSTDPGLWAIQSAGVAANDPAAINKITGGEAVMPNASVNKLADQLFSIPPADAVGVIRTYTGINRDTFMRQMGAQLPNNKLDEVVRLVEVASEDDPDYELFELHQRSGGLKVKEIEEAAGFTEGQALEKLKRNDDYNNLRDYHSGAVLGTQGNSYGISYTKTLARSALLLGGEKNATIDDAVSRVLSAPNRNFVKMNGTTYAVPPEIDTRYLRPAMDDFIEGLADLAPIVGGDSSSRAFADSVKMGKYGLIPVADPENNKLVLVEKSSRNPVINQSTGKPVVMTYNNLLSDFAISPGSDKTGSDKNKNIIKRLLRKDLGLDD